MHGSDKYKVVCNYEKEKKKKKPQNTSFNIGGPTEAETLFVYTALQDAFIVGIFIAPTRGQIRSF